jgi:hypothetical protein
MPRASTSLTTQLPPSLWRAGNFARSRLSGGSGPICTRPLKLVWRGSQASLHRILFNIRPNTIELRARSNQTIEAFLLPKGPVCAQEKIGLVTAKSLERAQPFCGKHVRSRQKMHVVRHHDERMKLIPVQFAVSMVQRRHHHFCDFGPAQKQRANGACVQEPVDGYERFAGGGGSGWWEYPVVGKTAMQAERDEQGLLDDVPMGQPPFVMPHTSLWCWDGGETLAALRRLKAGCGHDCPPSNPGRKVSGLVDGGQESEWIGGWRAGSEWDWWMVIE